MSRCRVCLILNSEECEDDCVYRDVVDTRQLGEQLLVTLRHSNIDAIYETLASLDDDDLEKKKRYMRRRFDVASEWATDPINGYRRLAFSQDEDQIADIRNLKDAHQANFVAISNNHREQLQNMGAQKDELIESLNGEIAVLVEQIRVIESGAAGVTIEAMGAAHHNGGAPWP